MRTTTLSILAACAATAFFAGGTLAQTNGTYLLKSTYTVSPATPTTTIEVWATWDDPAGTFAFGGTDYDLTAGDGVFSNPVNVLFPSGGLGTPGVTAGNRVTGAALGQLFLFPPGLFQLHKDDNPILMATYDWTATDFTPRVVGLVSSNTTFFTVVNPWLISPNSTQLYPHEFTPGSGVINVIPAPAVWPIVAVALATGARRRRS